jgi:hypothetical protein
MVKHCIPPEEHRTPAVPAAATIPKHKTDHPPLSHPEHTRGFPIPIHLDPFAPPATLIVEIFRVSRPVETGALGTCQRHLLPPPVFDAKSTTPQTSTGTPASASEGAPRN